MRSRTFLGISNTGFLLLFRTFSENNLQTARELKGESVLKSPKITTIRDLLVGFISKCITNLKKKKQTTKATNCLFLSDLVLFL